MLKNPAEYEKDVSTAKIALISRQGSPVSLTGVSAVYTQKNLND
jgi:hypothetical protein